jgi:hypothetical protein
MVDSSTYVSFNTVYHNRAIPRKKKYSFSYGAHEAEAERRLKIFCHGRTLTANSNLLWVGEKKLGSIKDGK